MSSSSSVGDFSCPCPRDGLYDVFISFRGVDTRSGFTDNLYRLLRENKIYTFMDVGLAGEVIDSLFEVIERSRMGVVVYSKKFASSDWCLRELEMIVQRREEKKMMMLPIFYKVDVRDVKQLTEKTVKYFDQHIEKYGKTTVDKWKDVVTRVGAFSGFPYKDVHGRSECDFIMQVIATIKKKLREWEQREWEERCQESTSSISIPAYNSGPATTEFRTRASLVPGPIFTQQNIGPAPTTIGWWRPWRYVSAWTILSFMSGIILLILTFVQTFFTTYSYYKSNT